MSGYSVLWTLYAVHLGRKKFLTDISGGSLSDEKRDQGTDVTLVSFFVFFLLVFFFADQTLEEFRFRPIARTPYSHLAHSHGRAAVVAGTVGSIGIELSSLPSSRSREAALWPAHDFRLGEQS